MDLTHDAENGLPQFLLFNEYQMPELQKHKSHHLLQIEKLTPVHPVNQSSHSGVLKIATLFNLLPIQSELDA